MKRIFKTLVVAICLFSTTFSNAQCFQKHAMFLDLGFGLGIYNTTVYNYTDKTTKTGKAGSFIVPLSFEYALGNRIGIGLQLVSQSFLSRKDSTSNSTPTAHSGELNVFGNYHFYCSDHTDIYAGLTIGGSNFTYNANNDKATTLSAGGPYVDIHCDARFLFGNHFGMLASIRFPTTIYVQGLATDNTGNEVNFDLKLRGTIIGTGFTYKF
jgi:hypothetical protein